MRSSSGSFVMLSRTRTAPRLRASLNIVATSPVINASARVVPNSCALTCFPVTGVTFRVAGSARAERVSLRLRIASCSASSDIGIVNVDVVVGPSSIAAVTSYSRSPRCLNDSRRLVYSTAPIDGGL